MVDFYQGPGRNITFCSITTGIDIDPSHGGIARAYYDWFKGILTLKSELHYEHRTINEVEIDASTIFNGYSTNPRLIYQFLYGKVEHSDGWTVDELTQAVHDTPFPLSLQPADGEYSVDWYASKEAGTKLFENLFVSLVNVWVEKREIYFSNVKPWTLHDGEAGDIWLAHDNGKLELWYKNVFTWVLLEDYVSSRVPAGTVTYSTTDPGNSTNSWWFDLTGLVIRKYSSTLNTWEPASTVVVSSTPPGGLADGELWLNVVNGKFELSVWRAGLGQFEKARFSPYPVQDKTTNSAFNATIGSENFVITCGDTALTGAPITGGGGTLEIRKDGALIATAVDCINFIGPDLDVTDAVTCVNVEHLPVTTLPEQGGTPTPLPDVGKVFTLDIGGVTELFYMDDAGNVIQLTNNGSTAQNIFLTVATFSAVAGQTVFPVPSSAKVVLTVKINGLDTLGWTYTTPSVVYNPVAGNYTIQAGDEITIIYYA